MSFKPINSELFFKRNNPEDLRLGDIASAAALPELSNKSNSYIVGGYPDDEGIKLNGGRPGAKDAPNQIRRTFYKMTPHLYNNANPEIFDIGNLDISAPIEQRHSSAAKDIEPILSSNKYISLGGGHDYAYPDGSAFLRANTSSKLKP